MFVFLHVREMQKEERKKRVFVLVHVREMQKEGTKCLYLYM